MNLTILFCWFFLVIFVAEELVAAAYQNIHWQILFRTFLYGVLASMAVTLVSSYTSTLSKTFLKLVCLVFLVSASSMFLFFATPYVPTRFTFGGPDRLYSDKFVFFFICMALSAMAGAENAFRVKSMLKALIANIAVLADPEKVRSFIRFLRTAGTS